MRKEEKDLPLAHQQHYEAFNQTLQQVQQMAVSSDVNTAILRSEVTALQRYFHDRLLSLSIDTFSATTQQWVQSYQVEMDKQLRLLGMDVLFLQAARQATTALQRQQQVCDRLVTLQRYCEALLGEEEKGEE